jgi:hypothetical protein
MSRESDMVVPLVCMATWQMNNRPFFALLGASVVLGLFLGRFLAFRADISISGLMNVIGIIYSLMAVVILYETISANVTYRDFTVNYLAPCILWAHSVIPLGVALSWFFSNGSPSGSKIASFGFSFFVYSILPLGFLDAAVVFPRIREWKPVEVRYRLFGLYLLLSGLVMQLIAALLAL